MDDEDAIKIHKIISKDITPKQKRMEQKLSRVVLPHILPLNQIVKNGYKQSNLVGDYILTQLISTLIIANTENVDTMLSRLNNINKITKNAILQIDKILTKGE